MVKLVPANFGYVTETIFRSAEPEQLHFPFLESLEPKTIVHLGQTHSEAKPALVAWASENHVNLVQCTVPEAIRGTMCEDTVIDVLRILLDQRQHPVLVTCATGRYRTGTVVACLRKMQLWNLSSILEEYRRNADVGKVGRLEDEQFIELFDTDLVTL
eukprot:PhM_4_TR13087/c1_g1_i1/m.56741